jgi:hypothetical protein
MLKTSTTLGCHQVLSQGNAGPTTCFPKADRFKDKPKEPLTFTDTIDLSTSVSETDSMQGVKFPRQ